MVIFGLHTLFVLSAITCLGLWGIAELTSTSLAVMLLLLKIRGSIPVVDESSAIIAIHRDPKSQPFAADEHAVAEIPETTTETSAMGKPALQGLPTETTVAAQDKPIPYSETDGSYTIVAERTDSSTTTDLASSTAATPPFWSPRHREQLDSDHDTRPLLGFLGGDDLNNK